MARYKLTLADRLKGAKAALKSKKTPPQLKEGIRRKIAKLEKEVG
jgi:hypothetical protein